MLDRLEGHGHVRLVREDDPAREFEVGAERSEDRRRHSNPRGECEEYEQKTRQMARGAERGAEETRDTGASPQAGLHGAVRLLLRCDRAAIDRLTPARKVSLDHHRHYRFEVDLWRPPYLALGLGRIGLE